jgi:hypothetical protein
MIAGAQTAAEALAPAAAAAETPHGHGSRAEDMMELARFGEHSGPQGTHPQIS